MSYHKGSIFEISQVGNISELEKLQINAGEINMKDEDGETPLSIAIGEGHVEFAKILVKRGANTEIKTNDDTTLLMNAVFSKNLQTVKYVIEDLGISNLNDVDEDSMTALHISIELNSYNIFLYLLGKGANPNIPNSYLDTPLHTASSLGYVKYVQALMDFGALSNTKNNKGNTPILLAEMKLNIYEEILRLIHK